jgi:hypothetical protein
MLLVSEILAGGAVTFNDTTTVFMVPAHGLGATQVAVTVV